MSDSSLSPEEVAEVRAEVEARLAERVDPTLVYPNGARLIMSERRRQVAVEGHTPELDDQHVDGELASASIAYVDVGIKAQIRDDVVRYCTHPSTPWGWPWELSAWRPTSDPVRNLTIAGALIAAEIDRLLRHSSRP